MDEIRELSDDELLDAFVDLVRQDHYDPMGGFPVYSFTKYEAEKEILQRMASTEQPISAYDTRQCGDNSWYK